MEDKDRDSIFLDLPMSPMSSRHHSSTVCESCTVTNLSPSQVSITESFSKPLAPFLNEFESCTPCPLQVYSRRKASIIQPIHAQVFEPVFSNEVTVSPLTISNPKLP